ncbi:MAG TPA: glycosyl hydrolase family 28-related protein, partial [Bacteroidales bacterium]
MNKVFLKNVLILSFFLSLFQLTKGQEKIPDKSGIYIDLPFKMPEVAQPAFKSNTVNIKDFGAKNDGITSNTKVFAAAISAIIAKGGGTVIIPEGLWLTGPIELKSNVRLY